jgi:hypothetical protein
MAECIKENGSITIWKVWVFILGQMGVDMKESIKMIKSTVMVSILGLIKEDIRVCGLRVNNMA